jgi:alpha-D-ribose 1-methylphosphonate 5-triphosphate synthase subunit PhnH
MPTMNETEAREHATFTALMWALSYPGRPHTLPVTGSAAFTAIAEALVDLETGYFTPHAALAEQLARTGGRAQPPRQALYQFYPQLTPSMLDMLAAAPVGTHCDPDLAATLVLVCTLDKGARLTLRGPGIPATLTITLGGIPPEFWPMRTALGVYPLGWDVFFVAGDQVIGLPRTTLVEVH